MPWELRLNIYRLLPLTRCKATKQHWKEQLCLALTLSVYASFYFIPTLAQNHQTTHRHPCDSRASNEFPVAAYTHTTAPRYRRVGVSVFVRALQCWFEDCDMAAAQYVNCECMRSGAHKNIVVFVLILRIASSVRKQCRFFVMFCLCANMPAQRAMCDFRLKCIIFSIKHCT